MRTKIYFLTFVRAIFTAYFVGTVILYAFGGLDLQRGDTIRELVYLLVNAVFIYLGFLSLRSTIENRKFWSLGNMNAFRKLNFSNWKRTIEN